MAAVPGAASLVLIVILSFRAGGYIVDSATPFVIAWLVVVGAWVLAVRPVERPPLALLTALGALGALALWTGLSIIWSVGPDLSWIAFNYAALYVAAALALAWGGSGRLQVLVATVGFLAGATAVAVYAYLGKVLPDQVTHAHEYARLAAPVGYWNVLAVMLVMAAPIALALAARRGLHPLLRAVAAAVLALLLITLFFTFSRGGFAAAMVMLVAYFVAARERLSSLVSLLLAAAPVGFVLWHLRDLETLFGPTTDAALRSAQAHTLAGWTILALGLPFALQVAVAYVHRRLAFRPLVVRWVGVAVLVLGLGLCIGGPLSYMQRQGGVGEWVSAQYTSFIEGSDSEGGDTAARVLVVSSNGRVGLYKVALRQYDHTPLVGTGAGTFAFSNYRFRDTGLFVKHAHSQWFNTLSELGIVGLALLTAFVLALAVAVVRSLVRLRRDRERGLLAACFAAGVGFVFHISGDWDWDMAAATLAFLLLTVTAAVYRGASRAPEQGEDAAGPTAPHTDEDEPVGVRRETAHLGTGEEGAEPGSDVLAAASGATPASAAPDVAEVAAAPPLAGSVTAASPPAADPAVHGRLSTGPARLSWPLAGRWAGLAAVLIVSWLLPSLALQAGTRALAAAGDGQLAVARAEAQRSQRLDPLAVGPLITLAGVEQRAGNPRAALAALEKAAALQPDNFYVHYQLGLLLANSLGRTEAAADAFRRALELNPQHTLSLRQLELLGRD